MPRIGVSYKTIKHTALKLLSQGTAPSVQKVREVLGTGSNTTIAEHLRTWREEYANKEVHHLPASMPKELVSAIEVLWQTAMEQASQQLASIKHNLTEIQEKLRLEKITMEKTDSELRTRIADSEKIINDKNTQIQTLQTELALVQEKLKQQIDAIQSIKQQYESRLQHVYDEKNSEIDNNEKLRAEIAQLKQKLNEQIEKYQSMLNEERTLQEESEKRWLILIDQARTETKDQRKRYENTIDKHDKKIEKLQSMLSELQQKYIKRQSVIEQKDARIAELSDQNNKIQEKYQNATEIAAVLQERLHHSVKNKATKPKSKNRRQLKVAGKHDTID